MLCSLCREKPVYCRCQGCQVNLCSDCVKLDLFGHGCGCVFPLLMCPTCINDQNQNPYTTGKQ
ncbi:MAG: hypothetical protein ACOX0F_11110 [Syntrophomonadaceae bacterium]